MSESPITTDSEVEAATVLGEHLIESILQEEPIEIIRELIAAGAPLWYQNETEGTSPLHAAAYVQNKDLVRLLIEEGAVWNAGG